MAQLITGSTQFDEDVRLKIHLNLEMNQQDMKIWTRHEALLQDTSYSRDPSFEKDNGTDYQLESLVRVIKNLFKLDCYNAERFEHAKHSASQRTQINADLMAVIDSIRSLMQQDSITWQMLEELKSAKLKKAKTDTELHEDLKRNQVLMFS